MSYLNEDGSERRSPWRNPWLWVAVGVVIVAAVAAVTWWGSRSGGLDSQQPSGQAAPSSTAPSGDGGGGQSSDGSAQRGYRGDDADVFGHRLRVPVNANGQVLEQDSQTSASTLSTPLDRPQGLEWQRVYGVPMPFSTSDGPRKISDTGVAEGFARTPQGAVLAWYHITMRAAFAPSEAARRAVVEQYVIGSTARKNELVASLADPDFAASRKYLGVPSGVMVEDSYSSTFARIRTVTGPVPAPQEHPTDDGQGWTEETAVMVWEDGHWKWRMPDTTQDTSAPDAGFIEKMPGGMGSWL